MNLFKKIFGPTKDKEKQGKKKKQKPSFFTWLCSSKSIQYQNDHCQHQDYNMNTLPLQSSSSTKKSTISIAHTNNTKIIQRLSFGHHTHREFLQEDLRSRLVEIDEQVIDSIGQLIEQDGLYGMVGGQQPICREQQQRSNNGIWLKIGKHQQINSLTHIKPYYFTSIFIFMPNQQSVSTINEFSIQQILMSKQNIFLKLQQRTSTQQIIDSYQKQLIEYFAFKPLSQCFPKLKLTIYRTKNDHSIWVQFNSNNSNSNNNSNNSNSSKQSQNNNTHVEDILKQIGFQQDHQQYQKLKQQIPNVLTLQQYMQFTQQKNKLMSKYQGESLDQYIRSKFLEKVNSKSVTPRGNIDSPRTLEKDKSNHNQQLKSQSSQSGYNQYILSMTANTLPRDGITINDSNNPNNDPPQTNPLLSKPIEKSSYQQQIFEFNIYKQDRQQQAKRVAISRERKKRSRSEDITVGDLNNYDDDLDAQSDYFDQRD